MQHPQGAPERVPAAGALGAAWHGVKQLPRACLPLLAGSCAGTLLAVAFLMGAVFPGTPMGLTTSRPGALEMFAMALAWAALEGLVGVGLARTLVNAVRGRPTPLSQTLGPIARWPDALATWSLAVAPRALVGLPLGLAMALRWLPGPAVFAFVPVAMLTWCFSPLAMFTMIDGGQAPLASVTTAWRATRGWRAALLVLIGGLMCAYFALLMGAALVWAVMQFGPSAQPSEDELAVGFLVISVVLQVLLMPLAGLILAGVLLRALDQHADAQRMGAPPTALVLRAPPLDPLVGGATTVALFVGTMLADPGPLGRLFWALAIEVRDVPRTVVAAATASAVGVPLLVGLGLSLRAHLRGDVAIDGLGVLIGPTSAWPGRRVRWQDLQGFRVVEGGLRLRPRGGWLEPLVTAADDEVQDVVALLEARGVKRVD